VNTDDFRRIALGLDAVVEGAHMGHPDFRVKNRIFATLHGDGVCGMVKLTPAQQQTFMTADPDAFSPENGAWGRAGCTRVRLAAAADDAVGEAMTLAWQNATAVKTPSRPTRPKRSVKRPRR
jgi:hypothetical protein